MNREEYDENSKEKSWKYANIPQDKTDANMTFLSLVIEFGMV